MPRGAAGAAKMMVALPRIFNWCVRVWAQVLCRCVLRLSGSLKLQHRSMHARVLASCSLG